jgi:hypothetical protein
MVGKAEIARGRFWIGKIGTLDDGFSPHPQAIKAAKACLCRKPDLAPRGRTSELSPAMRDVKDTARALVRISYDGRVFKTFRGPKAEERFENEVRILRHLEARGCLFVPRLLEVDPAQLRIVTTNCGSRVEHLDADRIPKLFAELEAYGVRHDDPDMRNVTYRQTDGRFCLIDFEFATLLPGAGDPPAATSSTDTATDGSAN